MNNEQAEQTLKKIKDLVIDMQMKLLDLPNAKEAYIAAQKVLDEIEVLSNEIDES